MYYKGYGYSPRPQCPYCGGMHPANQCPLIAMPPAMPSAPVPLPTPVPCPGIPAGGGMAEMMHEMHEMHQHMEKIEAMVMDIQKTVHEIHHMVQAMATAGAKG